MREIFGLNRKVLVSRRTRPNHSGFTLLELIVAVSILALIAVFSWRGLDTVLRTRDAIGLSQERIDGFQRGFNRIERDSAQTMVVQAQDAGPIVLQLADGSGVEYRLEQGVLWRRTLTHVNTGATAASDSESVALFDSKVDNITSLQVELYRRNAVPMPGTAAGSWQGARAVQGEASINAASSNFVGPAVSSPANNAATPNWSLQASTLPGGMRLTVRFKDGAVIQRIFLLGAGA